ncbi:MAG: tryptophan--tRNA ligase [Gammaproteobacteria bacterium]
MSDSPASSQRRVLSGMRPTGQLHLGNYHGALRNWVDLQHRYDCYFFVADWHALTTGYEDTSKLEEYVWEMVIDWLGAGLDPERCTLFLQSRVPEHAELHLLLSMVTPLGWLERVPTYKDQQEQLREKDLATYGFLGYPLLQSADILLYRPQYVPVGEDQVAHVEITREVARRFNHLFGRGASFDALAAAALERAGSEGQERLKKWRKAWQQKGDEESRRRAQGWLEGSALAATDREILAGWLDGSGRAILPEPEVLLTATPKVPGLDGRKMSKSYGNTIGLREDTDSVARKLRTMQTDPARVRRTDAGDPDKCPVFDLHRVYSSGETCARVATGCRTAAIGCLDCKQPLIDAVVVDISAIRNRSRQFAEDPARVREVIEAGCQRARDVAGKTMDEVRGAMGLRYR